MTAALLAFTLALQAWGGTYNGCKDIGNGQPSGRRGGDPALNKVKNRDMPPASTPASAWKLVPFWDASFNQPGMKHSDPNCAKMPKPLPGRRDKWTSGDAAKLAACVASEEKKLVGIEGYIMRAEMMGKESTNCNSTDEDMRDFHIWLVDKPGVFDKTQSLIVEVTPRLRDNLSGSPRWTEKEITDLAKNNSRVKVWGYKLFDQWHRSVKHRRSAWEIHPITHIEVWDKKKGAFVPLE